MDAGNENYKISLQTRVHSLNSLVISRLTYNCQTWSLKILKLTRSMHFMSKTQENYCEIEQQGNQMRTI